MYRQANPVISQVGVGRGRLAPEGGKYFRELVRNYVQKGVNGDAWQTKKGLLTRIGTNRKGTKSEELEWDTHRMRPKTTTSSTTSSCSDTLRALLIQLFRK